MVNFFNSCTENGLRCRVRENRGCGDLFRDTVMAHLLPTHFLSAHLLVFALGTVMVPCAAHEGEAGVVFDIVAAQRFEQRSDGVDSHVAELTTLDEFRVQVGHSRLPTVMQFTNDSTRAWGGNRGLYQDLASDFAGKVLFVSVDAARADEVVKRFMGMFLQLAHQARGKPDAYSTALRRRLATYSLRTGS